MKKYHAWGLYIFSIGLSILSALGAVDAPQRAELPPDTVIARTRNSRVWQRVTDHVLPDGRTLRRTNSMVELASGLHYQENGEWRESKEQIDLVPGGAEAVQGPIKVRFAANVNTPGAIDLTTPDDVNLRSHILGLAYTDMNTRQSVLIAELKDSIGVLVGSNQVIYLDAFTDFKADVRYTFTKGGFSQDVIWRENPPSPESFGLNPQTIRLEVFTEFLNAPVPVKKTTRQTRDGLADESISFGAARFGRGRGFPLPIAPGLDRLQSVPVSKTWEARENRQFLIEAVPYRRVKEALNALPNSAAIPNEKLERIKRLAQQGQPANGPSARPFPIAPKAARTTGTMRRMAALNPPNQGWVLDYQLLDSDDVRLEGDKTYYVSGAVSVGQLTIEGGVVVKYASGAYLDVSGTVDCLTWPFRPAIFTAKDDNTVGDIISGSTGIPSGYYADTWLYVNSASTIHDVRFSYATYGLVALADTTLRNIQFTSCGQAMEVDEGGTLEADNILCYKAGTVFFAYGGPVTARHLTAHLCDQLAEGPGVSNPLNLTNSLLVNVTNWGTTYYTTNAVVKTTDEAVFQTVGSGAHYLVDASPYRDAGSTNLPAALASDLRKKTTYPPVLIAPGGWYTVSLNLSPNCGRDTDLPDLGYHYDPIDYAIWFIGLSNATIQASAGTVVAVFNPTNSGAYGFGLCDGAKLYCDGHADAKVNIAHYSTVQEMANTNWAGPVAALVYNLHDFTTTPEARYRFTDFSVLGGTMPSLFSYDLAGPASWNAKDCQFHGGAIYNGGGPDVVFTNCLFNRVNTTIYVGDTGSNHLHNCTFHAGYWETYWDNPSKITFTDNLFAGTDIEAYSDIASSHIGYTTNCINRLITTNSNDTVVNSLTFQTGTLGHFYIPTNAAFINAGSRNATNAGLFHYTMLTNNVKETNTVVDIGFHVPATDANGTPLDHDEDGVPDYWEDTNGNGSVDAGEISWLLFDTDGDGVGDGLELLQGRNPLGGTLTDTNNLLNLRVFTPLK